MRRLRHILGKLLHWVAKVWFCDHTIIQQRRDGEMWLRCFTCRKWIAPAGFERSALANRLDRQQRRAQKKRGKRESGPVIVRRIA